MLVMIVVVVVVSVVITDIGVVWKALLLLLL